MITERLKNETAEQHKATEQVSFGNQIMSGTLTLEEYGILIEKNYILHALIENALEKSNLLPEGINWEARKKTASLEKDMQLLGKSLPELPAINITFNDAAEALGAMYVVEGATLGGSYILKALVRNQPIVDAVGSFNYYGVYGDQIGPLWKSFQEVLIKEVATPESEDAAIKSAIYTFELFKSIFVGQTA